MTIKVSTPIIEGTHESYDADRAQMEAYFAAVDFAAILERHLTPEQLELLTTPKPEVTPARAALRAAGTLVLMVPLAGVALAFDTLLHSKTYDRIVRFHARFSK